MQFEVRLVFSLWWSPKYTITAAEALESLNLFLHPVHSLHYNMRVAFSSYSYLRTSTEPDEQMDETSAVTCNGTGSFTHTMKHSDRTMRMGDHLPL